MVNGVMAAVGAILGGIWLGGWTRRRNGVREGEERRGARSRYWDEKEVRE